MKEKLDFNYIPISKIKKIGNIRDDSTEIDELKTSIKAHGLLQPIIVSVSEKNYKLIAGHRRLKACQALNWEEIPAVINDYKNHKIIQLTENMQRKEMNRIEESETIYELYNELSVTVGRLGRILGKNPAWLEKRINLYKVREHLLSTGMLPTSLIDSMSFDIAWIVGKYEKKYWLQMCSNLLGKTWYPEKIRDYCKGVVDPNYIPQKKKYTKTNDNQSITGLHTDISDDYKDEFSILKNDSECIIKLLCTTKTSYKYLISTLQEAGGELL
jgi:ParB/RepB/Spo0J family partition protein